VEASSQLHALTAFRLGKRSRFSVGYDAKMMLDEPRLQCGPFGKKKYPSLSETKPNSSILQPEEVLAMPIKLSCFLWYTVTGTAPLRKYLDTEELIYNTLATECNSSMAPSSTPYSRFHHWLQQTWYLSFLFNGLGVNILAICI